MRGRLSERWRLGLDLRLSWADRCAAGGSIGNRTADTEGRPRGRFPVGGILPWREHGLWFFDRAVQGMRPAPAGSVVVFIDNS